MVYMPYLLIILIYLLKDKVIFGCLTCGGSNSGESSIYSRSYSGDSGGNQYNSGYNDQYGWNGNGGNSGYGNQYGNGGNSGYGNQYGNGNGGFGFNFGVQGGFGFNFGQSRPRPPIPPTEQPVLGPYDPYQRVQPRNFYRRLGREEELVAPDMGPSAQRPQEPQSLEDPTYQPPDLPPNIRPETLPAYVPELAPLPSFRRNPPYTTNY